MYIFQSKFLTYVFYRHGTFLYYSAILDFLYLLQTLQYILTYLDSIENILILFCPSFYIH